MPEPHHIQLMPKDGEKALGKTKVFRVYRIKQEAIKYYDKYKKFPSTIPNRTGYRWLKQRQKIFSTNRDRKHDQKKGQGLFVGIKAELYKEIIKRNEKGFEVHILDVQTLAQEIKKMKLLSDEVQNNLEFKEKLQNFKMGQSWCHKFIQDYNLGTHKGTKHIWHIPKDRDRLLIENLSQIQELMRDKKVPFENIINMDEMCLSCDPSVRSTISPIGKEQVLIRFGQHYKACNTVAVTTRANGTILFLTFVFKRLTTQKGLKKVTDSLPLGPLYLGNKNGFVNTGCFIAWYEKLHNYLFPPALEGSQFTYSGMTQHYIILVDSATSHKISELPHMKRSDQLHFVIIPKGCTPYAQPNDLVINANIKHYYTKQIRSYQEIQFDMGQPQKIQRIHVVNCIQSAIAQVKPSTIISGFLKAGITQQLIVEVPNVEQIVINRNMEPEEIAEEYSIDEDGETLDFESHDVGEEEVDEE